MLVSYLGKEGIWQVRILSVMMLWTVKFPAEVWKCESKACIESRHQAQTCAEQEEYSASAFHSSRKGNWRKGRQSAA